MTTFVLVHGAWHGSWCWKRVRPLLQSQGHTVFTPTLSGVGERSHLLTPAINLETHILDVLNLILWEDLSDVVLVGHSYGGAIVTAVADRLPQRIRALVYVDAFLLEDGESLSTYSPLTPARVQDGWKVMPIPAAVLAVNPADRAWVDSQCTPQSVDCHLQPLRLGGGFDQVKDITYIRGFGFGGETTFVHQFYRKAQARGWRTHLLPCGHDIMLDQPSELAAILLDTAARAAAG